MKRRPISNSRQFRPQSRFSLRMAWLILFCIVAHSFDACAAHVSVFDEPVAAVSSLECNDSPNGVCASCRPTQHAPDLCEIISEVSTSASHSFQLEMPAIIVSSLFATPADFFVLAPPSQTIRSRDGPDIPTLVSLCQRSTLPGRSPPFSA